MKMLSKNYLTYKTYDELLRGSVEPSRLIEIGRGEKPYAAMIRPYVTAHLGLDHQNTLNDKSRIDLFRTAYDISVKDEHFDTVLCTAVLEHLEERDKAIKKVSELMIKR